MRLDFIKGYFDVREYNAKKQRSERTIKGEDATITFDVVYDAQNLPEQVAKHAKSYVKDGVTKFIVKFKISKTTKWFERIDGKVVFAERPSNVELDGKRYECCVDYRELNGDPDKQEACGYWVNGIVIKEDDSDMFADLNTAEEKKEEPKSNNNSDDLDLDF